MPIHTYEAHDLKLSTFLPVTSFKACKNYSLCRRGNCHWFTRCRELNWFHRVVKGQDMAWDTLLPPYMKMWFYTRVDEFSSPSRKSSTKSDSFLLVKESLYIILSLSLSLSLSLLKKKFYFDRTYKSKD